MIPLCSSPFQTLSFKPEGLRPCCSRHATPITLKEGEDWWNSEYLTEFRKKMFDPHTLPDECVRCAMSDNLGGHKYSRKIHVDKEVGYDHETGRVTSPPWQVLYFTGNKCNLACRMCDNTFSSTFSKLLPELNIPIKEIHTEQEERYGTIDAIVGIQPTSVIVYGGEPFMDPKLYEKAHRMLYETSATISFLSNGSYPLDKHPVFELMKNWPKRFTIAFSIDGPPELNERIRINCKTQMIEKNIATCKANGIDCDIHITLSNMNVHALPETIEYIEGTLGTDIPYNAAAVEYPDYFAPHIRKDAKAIMIRLKKFYWEKTLANTLTVCARNAIKETMNKLISPCDDELFDKSEQVTRYIDQQVNDKDDA